MVIILIVALAVIAALAGIYASYYKTFYSPHKGVSETVSPSIIKDPEHGRELQKMIDQICEVPCEYVSIRSFDGLKLSARYYKGRSDMPMCICFHGYRGSAVRDFSAIGLYLIDKGYNVLNVDERAHWRSEGHTITFGIKERFDVLSWIEYSNKRFGNNIPIYLFGISMGGGTVLMASGLELSDNVKAILADCPMNSPKDSIKHVCKKIHLNPTLSWPIVWLAALIYGHFNVSKTIAAKEVKKTKKPILIMHGEGDDFVPMYMSKEVKDANPDMVEWHSFPDAGHGMSYFYDKDRYLQIMDEFMERNK